MKRFKFYILLSMLVFISSCGSLREGFISQKKNNSDEFLVEKKSPLTMPPNFSELPVPAKVDLENQTKDNEIKELIIKKKIEDNSNKSKNISNSFEQSILEKINKN